MTEQDFIDNFSIELTNTTVQERKEIAKKYYKQLARKEKECEQYKKLCEQKTVDNFDLIKQRDEIENTSVEIIRDYRKKCEELKKQLETMNQIHIDKMTIIDTRIDNKYKQVLQKIKEIADENIGTAQYGGICKSIIQKINEVIYNVRA